jgi:hypothetical protein
LPACEPGSGDGEGLIGEAPLLVRRPNEAIPFKRLLDDLLRARAKSKPPHKELSDEGQQEDAREVTVKDEEV